MWKAMGNSQSAERPKTRQLAAASCIIIMATGGGRRLWEGAKRLYHLVTKINNNGSLEIESKRPTSESRVKKKNELTLVVECNFSNSYIILPHNYFILINLLSVQSYGYVHNHEMQNAEKKKKIK